MSRLKFEKYTSSLRKTPTWVVTNATHEILGQIQWHAPWRTFTFRPGPQTQFDHSCLIEIQEFLQLASSAQRLGVVKE